MSKETYPVAVKFRFPLQAVLDHRSRIEDQRRRELAEAEARRHECHETLRTMQQTIVGSRSQLRSGLQGRVDMSQVAAFAGYSLQARDEAQLIVQRLALIERDIEAARQRLADAARQRKALELLREKQLAQWQSRQQRREVAELDEIATQAHARRSGAERSHGRETRT